MPTYMDIVDCIIPAAGLSERMGRWKPLISYPAAGGKPLVEVSVERALETCSRVVLVTGYRGDELERLFDDYPCVDCVRNEEFRRGMFSSIQTGARLIEAPFFFIAHADMPELPAELYRFLLEKIGKSGERTGTGAGLEGEIETVNGAPDIVRPLYRGLPGHPVLCRHRVAATILAEAPDSNMQRVMRRHNKLELEVQWPGCAYDIDSREDL